MINIPIQHHGKFTIILMLSITDLKRSVNLGKFLLKFSEVPIYFTLGYKKIFFKF